MNDIVDVTTIRQLNDELRQTLRGGIVTTTPGVMALGELRQLEVLKAVARFESMLTTTLMANTTSARWMLAASGSFGKSTTSTERLTNHSPDPTDPAVTTRVLTIMLAAEY